MNDDNPIEAGGPLATNGSVQACVRSGDSSPAWFTTLPIDTEQGRIAAYNAGQQADFSVSECIGQEIAVANLLIHPVSLENADTGELKSCQRVVMISSDGTTYACVSEGILRALARIEGIYGRAPWNPPIKVVPENAKGRGANRYYTLKLIGR
jgi:single-stranded DNA-binding protein